MSRVPVRPVSSVRRSAYEPDSGGTNSADRRVPSSEIASGMSAPSASARPWQPIAESGFVWPRNATGAASSTADRSPA